jgi:opine dehydrogenase
MAPHLSTGQVVFLPPGSFGTFAMSREVRRLGNDADVAWAETGTLPYLARKHAENEVNVSVRAVRLPTGVYPARLTAHAMPILQKAYPSVIPCENGLSAALLNAGPIIHPPLMIMNAAPLEHFDKWDIHNEGTQPSVRAVTDQLDRERILIREALGYMSNHFPLSDHYNSDRWMYGDAHKALVKSGDWREKIDLYHHRYVLEDIEIGLVFLSSISEYLKIKTPVIDGILALTSAFLKRDLKSSGRSFKTMGLDKYSLKELDHLLFVGEGQ